MKTSYTLKNESRYFSLDNETDLSNIVDSGADSIRYCRKDNFTIIPSVGDYVIGSDEGNDVKMGFPFIFLLLL